MAKTSNFFFAILVIAAILAGAALYFKYKAKQD